MYHTYIPVLLYKVGNILPKDYILTVTIYKCVSSQVDVTADGTEKVLCR
jgi:hypothetical protein